MLRGTRSSVGPTKLSTSEKVSTVTQPSAPPPSSPPPGWASQADSAQSSSAANGRKRAALIAGGAVLGVGALIGTFFIGRVTVDPTASTEYKSKVKAVSAAEDQLEAKDAELSSVREERDEAAAQVDALVADLPALETGGDAPAVSEGVAIAARNVKLDLKVREKQCFGSAGCNVTVQVDPTYVGNQDVSSGSWEITYEIRGGEDGAIIETMTLEDGTWTFPEEQSLQTTSSNTKLTAVATEVYALD